MRCADCLRNPDSPSQHCACCGRELAREAASAAERPAIAETPRNAARHCRVCGASISEGEFCAGCLGSFSAWVCAEPAIAPEAITAPPPVVKTPHVDSLWSELMNTPAPPEWIDPDPSPKQTVRPPAVAHTPAIGNHEGANVAVAKPAPDNATLPSSEMPPPRLSAPAGPDVTQREAVPIEPIKLEPVRSPLPAPTPARMPESPARAASKPTPVSNHLHAAVPSRSRGLRTMSAVAVVLAVGLAGGYWIKVHGWFSLGQREAIAAALEPAREPQPASPKTTPKATPARTAPAEAPKPARTPVSSTSAAARRLAAAPSKPRAASAPAPEPIPAAKVSLPVETVALVEAPRSAAPTAPTPAAPQGPFFEPTDVNEAPRVATRVEPAVPDDLRSRARNEIVIVRMLVSHSGHPSRVSLLRRSKTGPRLDEAVIAAVSQWTFSPAKKRGEAVSCWFNMGVPVMAN